MSDQLHDELAALRKLHRQACADRDELAEELRLMVSYLTNHDQDANHQWMVKHMTETLNGDPHLFENKKNA